MRQISALSSLIERARRRSLEIGVVVFLAATLLPIAAPFLREGFPYSHDGAHHLVYAYRFDRAVHQGQLPVRWAEPILPGRGQPLFSYYQVGFYYFVSAVHEVVPKLGVAVKTAIVLLWWLGAAFMYLLCRRLGPVAAAGAALTFAVSPYLITDVFVRGAFPEFSAITFGVAALWTLDRFLFTGSTRWLAAMALALAAMMACHLAASLVMAPVFLAYLLWLWIDDQTSTGRIVQSGLGAVLAVGVVAFYFGPVLLEAEFVQLDRLKQNALDYRRYFVPLAQLVRFTGEYHWSFGASVSDPADLMPVHVSLLEWALFITGLFVMVRAVHHRIPSRTALGVAVWLGVTTFALLMMSALSAPVWDWFPPLAFVQFPWKFFMLLSIAGGPLTAVLLSAIPRRGVQIVALIAIFGVQAHFHYRHLRPKAYGESRLYDVDRPGWSSDPEVQRWDFFERALNPVGAENDPVVKGRWSVANGDADVAEMEGARSPLVAERTSRLDCPSDDPHGVFPGLDHSCGRSSCPATTQARRCLYGDRPRRGCAPHRRDV